MNICLFNRLFHRARGGIESYTARMAKAFADKGHTVHIITTPGDKVYDLGEHTDHIYIHYIDDTVKTFKGYWRINQLIPLQAIDYHKKAYAKFKEIIKEHPIDVVEVPDFDGFMPVAGRKFPLVVRMHGYHGMTDQFGDENCSNVPGRYLYRKWIQKFCDSAEIVSAVSQNFADNFAEIMRINKKNLVICRLAVDNSIFNYQNGKTRDEKLVAFVGRLEKSKGIEVIMRAIPKVAQEMPDTKFVLIGRDREIKGTNETYASYIKRELKKYNVELTGPIPQSQVSDYYHKAALAVFPSLFEPGGTVSIESIFCGCPVIVSNVGGFAECYHNREDAIVIEPDSSDELADNILNLLNNKKLRTKLSKNALHMAENTFSLDKIADQSIDIYNQAIEKFKSGKKVAMQNV